MTKRFALPDTLPTPYFTVDAGADATLAVRIAPCEKKGEARMSVEVWRDETILCRVFAKSAQLSEEPKAATSMETKEQSKSKAQLVGGEPAANCAVTRKEEFTMRSDDEMSANFDPKAMEALAKQMIQDGTMPPMDKLVAALARIRKENGPKILAAREQDQKEASSQTPPSPLDS